MLSLKTRMTLTTKRSLCHKGKPTGLLRYITAIFTLGTVIYPVIGYTNTACPAVIPAKLYWHAGSALNITLDVQGNLSKPSLSLQEISSRAVALSLAQGNADSYTRTSSLDGSESAICYQITYNGNIVPNAGGGGTNCGAGIGVSRIYWGCPANYTLSGAGCFLNNPNVSACSSQEDESGAPDFCPVGNPVNQATGNKYQIETDYISSGPHPLIFQRFYNSKDNGPGSNIRSNWRSTFDRSVYITSTISDSFTQAIVNRQDGKSYFFTLNDNTWVPSPHVIGALVHLMDGAGNITGWQYTNSDGDIETFNADGKLTSITNRSGIVQVLTYDAFGRLSSVTDSLNRNLALTYDNSNRLLTLTDPAGGIYTYSGDTITYPDGKSRTYLYNEPAYTQNSDLPYALTGVIDENGNRYATWYYDPQGRAISSEHAGGVGKISLIYNDDGTGSTTVTDALGTARTYSFLPSLVSSKTPASPNPAPVAAGACKLNCVTSLGLL